MGFRFRKSFKIVKGVRMTVTHRGVSLGARYGGVSASVGTRGTRATVGIPGTGLSYETRSSWSSNPGRSGSRANSSSLSLADVNVFLNEDGSLKFKLSNGSELPENLSTQVKRMNSSELQKTLQLYCDTFNQELDQILNIHQITPFLNRYDALTLPTFEKKPPWKPEPERLGFWASLFSRKRTEADIRHKAALEKYQEELIEWQTEKDTFESSSAEFKNVYNRRTLDVGAMEQWLSAILQLIPFPRETSVSYEIIHGGETIYLDVDLPEIEDMPKRKANYSGKGYKVTFKELSDIQIRKDYMTHVHGIGFLLAGETFAALPNCKTVVISGYSQRPDKKTGQIQDEYLYSVKILKSKWEKLDLNNVKNIDLVECLGSMEIVRNMTKTGVFKPIEPMSFQ